MSADTAPSMPEWAPPKGPWCLKQWLRFNEADQKVDTCLLPPDHDDDCRGIQGRYHNHDTSLKVGQLKVKAVGGKDGD